MAVVILTDDAGNITYLGDVTRTETHMSVLDVTEHAMETGASASDNARRHLDNFSCDFFVSNQPLLDLQGRGGQITTQTFQIPALRGPIPFNPLGAAVSLIQTAFSDGTPTSFSFQSLTFAKPFDAVKETLDSLRGMQDNKTFLTVTTAKATYKNCLVEKVNLKRTPGDGGGGSFSVDFKQVRIVSLAFADLPTPAEPRGAPNKPKGKQAPVTQDNKTSLLAKGTNVLSGKDQNASQNIFGAP